MGVPSLLPGMSPLYDKDKSSCYPTFAAMLRNLLVAFFLGMSFCLFAQTSGNPFDLKFRPAKPIEVVKPVRPDTIIDSLQKAKDLKPTVQEQTDKSAYEDTSIVNLGTPQPDTLQKSVSGNPFELNKDGDTSHAVAEVQPTIKRDSADTKPPQLVPPGLIKNSSKGFQIFLLLLSLLFLIFIVNVERNFVRDLWRVIANENYSSLHHRNQRNTMRQILQLMGYAVFIFQAGIFIYHAMRIFHYQGAVKISIWLPMIMVLGIYVVRHVIIHYLRWLFNNQKEMTLFGFDISIFNTMVGLVLLPINILLLFGPESMYKPLIIIGIAAFIGAYLMRQLRWMLTARGLIAHSLFLFFVYLCTVEILPLWALSKFFW